ncbi:hypothetical protein PBY51_020953 [Eleginops maclovinus]|uniref:Uncharacterized protein n=1 Tax=Eleginops maclovinus TaxID=56733 RepID=A0AAN7X866_ELEMC|nr:hypothetical protein PBY51_020953 [Eleginops maclovinus]
MMRGVPGVERSSQRRCEERTASDGGRAHQKLRRLLRAERGRVRGGRHGCQSRSTAECWNTRQTSNED